MGDLTADGVAARFKSDRAVTQARRLRKQMTPAEKALWSELRRCRLAGPRFRRQAPVGPFIIDFVCHAAKLAIEIDGGVHDAPDVALQDAERQQWIEGRGYRLMPFTNAEVRSDVKRVSQFLITLASARLPPT